MKYKYSNINFVLKNEVKCLLLYSMVQKRNQNEKDKRLNCKDFKFQFARWCGIVPQASRRTHCRVKDSLLPYPLSAGLVNLFVA